MGEYSSSRRPVHGSLTRVCGTWQGIFPHGIETLRSTDFYIVSVRHRAFLEGAVAVARYVSSARFLAFGRLSSLGENSFEEYSLALLQHLTGIDRSSDTGILHYDPDIRALSARALGKIAENRATEIVAEQIHLQVRSPRSLPLRSVRFRCLPRWR